MRYTELTEADKHYFRQAYKTSKTSRQELQERLAKEFKIGVRTVRLWAQKLEAGQLLSEIANPGKVLIYDLETSRGLFKAFWTGKQYINYKQMVSEPEIISIGWKWLGENEVHVTHWDKNHSDEKMVTDFIKIYNEADLVIGFNNDSFDNRWLNARAFKYGLDINIHVRSLDLYKQEKRLFRMLSYSMDYASLYAKIERKQSHEGIHMWDMVEDGTPEQQEEYLGKMMEYNRGDIVTTEELYLRMLPYLSHKMHMGVLQGGEKWSCPATGSENVEPYKAKPFTVTAAGTIQRIMFSVDTGAKYKITNKQYMAYLDHKIKERSTMNP